MSSIAPPPSPRGGGRLRPLRLATYLTSLLVALLLFTLRPVCASSRNIQMREMDSDAIVPLRSHSLYAPYVDSNLQNKFWDFGADAIVDTNKHIRLTQDRPHQMGWLWSRLPLTADNFEISFEFKVAGHASHVAGDGMAVWLTQERAKPGPVFGSVNYFTGLGLFFDTYPNSRHPYSFPRISLMSGNGVEAYENDKDGARQEVAGCSIDYRNAKVATKGKIIHVKDVYTELLVHHSEWDHWESCFKLDNITLPLNPYLGFSALTGDVSDNHDLVSVTSSNIVYRNRTPQQLREERKKHFPEKFGVKPKKKGWSFGGNTKGYSSDVASNTSGRKSGGGFTGFVKGVFGFLFFLIKWALILAAVGALGMLGWQWRKRQNMKRF